MYNSFFKLFIDYLILYYNIKNAIVELILRLKCQMIFEIKVVPSSGKQKCIIDKSGLLKCYLKNPAKNGLANNELIKFFAKLLKVTQHDVEIISGITSKKKRIRLHKEITYEQLLKLLNIEIQGNIF